jgi:hypothetical protein
LKEEIKEIESKKKRLRNSVDEFSATLDRSNYKDEIGYSGEIGATEYKVDLDEAENISNELQKFLGTVINYIGKGAFEGEDVLIFPPDAQLPHFFSPKVFAGNSNSRNKLFVRKSWKHLVEIMNYAAEGGEIDGFKYKPVMVEGPTGDGKVFFHHHLFF